MSNASSFAYGIHTIDAMLSAQPQRIIELYVQAKRDDQKLQAIKQLAKKNNIKIITLSKDELDRMTQHANHQGVVVLCKKAKSYSEADLEDLVVNLTEPAFFLVLDGIQDPHNLGACLRSADAAGVHAVIAPKDKSVGLTATASKVASGAAETVPFIQVTNLARTLRFLKDNNIWIYGADSEAPENLFKGKFTGSVAMVLGAEGSGLRRLTREHCDGLYKIPMSGSVSSLNVSVATGIFLFEVVRQRLRK